MKRHHGILSIAILAFMTATGTAVAQPTVLFRINATGPDYTDTSGNLWTSDVGSMPFNVGKEFSVDASVEIAGTDDDTLYQSERYDSLQPPEMTYSFPVANGNYRVRLYFAEIFFSVMDRRIFDVEIEDNLVLDDYDIVASVGSFTAEIKEFVVEVTDGSLDIDFLHVPNPANPPASFDNPKISAIMIETAEPDPEITNGDPASLAVDRDSTCPNPNNEITLNAQDPDTAAVQLTWSVMSGPSTGTVSFDGGVMTGANVTVCYEPDGSQSADDQFIVQVDDQDGHTDEITIDVTVNNASPVIDQAGPIDLDVEHDTACPNPANEVALSATDADGDDANLTWQLKAGAGPATGVVSFPAGNTGANVTVCYEPDAGQADADGFTVEVDDGNGGMDEIDVNVDVAVNDTTAPAITCPADATITIGDSTAPADLGAATAIDELDPAPTIGFDDSVVAGDCPVVEVITRTWTAMDASGNEQTCRQTITVNDQDGDGDTVSDCEDQCPSEDDRIDDNGDGTPDCLQDPGSLPAPNDCCGGVTPMTLPFMLSGYGWLRRRTRRKHSL